MNRIISLAAMSFVAFATFQAHASETYPTSQITIVVPWSAGGGTDLVARHVANSLQERFDIPVVVDNQPGASGMIGSDHVAKADPDGSVLLLNATPHVINPSMYSTLPYDTVEDFKALAIVATSANALAVHANVPVDTVQELIELAKEQPGMITYGSAGVGTSNHLSGELFNAMAGVEMLHVPYQGAAPTMTALLGEHIAAVFNTPATLLPYVADGQVRVLGVTSLVRDPSLPDVPTIDEAGVEGFEALSWFGMFAPVGLSDDTKEILVDALQDILGSDEIGSTFAEMGYLPGTLFGEEFDEYVNAEITKWSEVAERAGIEPQ